MHTKASSVKHPTEDSQVYQMNGSSDATFHPPRKACKDAISSTEINSMTRSDCCFDAAKQTKIQGKTFLFSKIPTMYKRVFKTLGIPGQ